MHSEILSRVCFLKENVSSKESITKSENITKPVMNILRDNMNLQSDIVVGIEKWLKYMELKQTMLVLRAVNHQTRKTIMCLLEKHTTMTVTDIYLTMKLDQSVASQHLAVLRKAGMVDTDKNGKYIYYSLNRKRLDLLSDLVVNLGSSEK